MGLLHLGSFLFFFISLSQPEGTYTLAAMHPKNNYFYFFLLSPERRRKVQKKYFLSKVFFLSEDIFFHVLLSDSGRYIKNKNTISKQPVPHPLYKKGVLVHQNELYNLILETSGSPEPNYTFLY